MNLLTYKVELYVFLVRFESIKINLHKNNVGFKIIFERKILKTEAKEKRKV